MSQEHDYPTELVEQFVRAAHFDINTVKSLLDEHPGLLNIVHDWGPGGLEDALGAASHIGNREIAEYLLSQGAPLTICAAAMLGKTDEVRQFLQDDASLANAKGAHGIPIMVHVAMGGHTDVAALLKEHGCTEGYNSALHGAAMQGHVEMTRWLLENGVTDVNMTNMAKKTPLEIAQAGEHDAVVALLREHGAVEKPDEA